MRINNDGRVKVIKATATTGITGTTEQQQQQMCRLEGRRVQLWAAGGRGRNSDATGQ